MNERAERKGKNSRSIPARVFRFCLGLLCVVLLLVGGLLGFLSATEYRPADRETVEINGGKDKNITAGETFRIMSWNIGYGALGDNADFFMDGGSMVNTADEERLLSNMEGIMDKTDSVGADLIFFQEADRDSTRSHHIDEVGMLSERFPQYSTSFANNFKTAFVPYPLPPIGKVDSGIATFSTYKVDSAERIQLPIPFAWPVRMANLKRCLLVSRLPVEGTDKELVLVNLHLEAYDNGEGKAAQTAVLAELLEKEAEKGNYVIAGGDFNQIFSPVDPRKYMTDPDKWQAGRLYITNFDGVWQFMMDEDIPSCRSLDQPYEDAGDDFQFYLIDGFIASSNVRIKSIENEDMGFEVSDHNPVVMEAELKTE